MIEEQVILVQYRPDGCGHQVSALTLRRSDQPEAFDGYVELAGGIARGQTRPLFEGFLRMNADRSLTYSEPSDLHEPSFERTLQPDEPGYDDLLVRVGGLVPGERKMVAHAPN